MTAYIFPHHPQKKSPPPRLGQLCPPCATPSSNSSLDYRRSDARFVENGFAASSGVNKSAKVVLVSLLMPRRRPDRALPLAALPQPPRRLRVLCLEARPPL